MLSSTLILFRKCSSPFLLKYSMLKHISTKVPKHPSPAPDLSKLPPVTEIDRDTIEHLERLSLVDFGDEKGIKIVEEAVRFADHLFLCNTDGIEPLTTVLEDRSLSLREDFVNEGDCKEEILLNSKFVEEDYFIAPPGNIPLKPKEYDLKKVLKIKNEQSN